MRDRRLTRVVAGLVRRDPGAVRRIAALLDVDASTVSHWLSDDGERRYHVPLDALPAVCDALDSIEVLRIVADELGHEVAPRSRPTSEPRALESGIWALLEHASRCGIEVQSAARDGRVDPAEARRIRSALISVRDVAEGMLSRLPGGVA